MKVFLALFFAVVFLGSNPVFAAMFSNMNHNQERACCELPNGGCLFADGSEMPKCAGVNQSQFRGASAFTAPTNLNSKIGTKAE